MNKPKKKYDAASYQKEETTQYNLRFVNDSGIPEALNRAHEATGEAVSQYMKGAIVSRLKSDGFLSGDIVLNKNKARHEEKLRRLEAYVIAEKAKLKK